MCRARMYACVLLASVLRAGMTSAAPTGLDFPGPPPGPARASVDGGCFTLANAALSATWELRDGALRPASLTNRLSGATFDQTGTELFRLGTAADAPGPAGVVVGLRLDPDRVVALASRDGLAWSELAAFPRADFPGEPRLVRLGKLSLKAQARHNPDLGAPGEATLSELSPPAAVLPDGRWTLAARAHEGLAREYPFPAGTRQIACRIDKGTDQGMSWGPALAFIWEDGQRFVLVGVRERTTVFNITTARGEQIRGAAQLSYPRLDLPASALRLAAPPRTVTLTGDPRGVRVADTLGGAALEADLTSDGGLRAHWRAELRDGSNYVRQTLALAAPGAPVALSGVELADVRLPDARTIGQCPGCPVAGAGLFLGVEIPGARNAVGPSEARIGFGCKLTLSPAQSYSFGAVTGVAPEGQLRRAFLCYVERERARPSRPRLHYNCWYDLGFGVDAAGMLDVVRQFDAELVRKRGVPVESYLVDDGWDDPGKGLWVENLRKFPGGFAALKQQFDAFGAHLGVWISPLGGYGGDHERTNWARRLGLIPPTGSLDLAEPAYKQWFEQRCLTLMKDAGVNAFKWDRAGEGVSPHFMALLDIAHHLRAADPDVFINVTVGTWPSPFWLPHVDSTWRMGSADVGWDGPGDDRERWLTFRDGWCRRLFVEQSPLYPLNSVMHHGLVHGRCFQGDKVGKAGANLLHEARSYFATGTSLQELYLTPSMMTPDAWDRVAEAAKWARANAEVLRDAHWVGGDPLRREPYGYAAWSPRGATLMLRNPDEQPHTLSLDAATVFELPAGAAKRLALTSPYADQRVQRLTLVAREAQAAELAPFEVLVFDAAR